MTRKITALVLALAMVLAIMPGLSVSVSASVYLERGLVLHYSFDSDPAQPDTITDDSGNGYNGSVLNTVEQGGGSPWGGGEAVSNVLTIEGGVAHFPGGSSTSNWPWGGTQYHTGAAIKIPEEVKEQITDSFTVTMWVKADTNYEYHTGLQRLFDFGSDTRDSVFLRYQGGSTAQLRFQDRGIASGADDENSFVAGNTSLAEGQWAFIAAVYDADNSYVSIYINDKYNAIASRRISKFRSIADLNDVTNDTYGFFIGRTQWWKDDTEKAKNPDFGGWIDDVRIYNRAVPSEEIEIFYHETYHAPGRKTIVSGTNLSYTVKQGGSIVLPGSVNVTFDDGSIDWVNVVWDEIPEEALSTVGAFTVRGTVKYSGIDYGKIMSASITVTSANSNLDEGLEVYYSFENDGSQPGSITDDSGNGRTGQVMNNNDRRNQRRITTEEVSNSRVARFPGGTWMGNGAIIKIPEDARSNINGDYTVSMWVKADGSYDFKSNLQRFFDFGVSTTDSIFARYRVTDGDLRFQDRGIGGGADDANSYISTNNGSFVDNWGLLTVTYTAEDNTATVYVNGEPVMSGDKFTRSLGDIPELTNSTYGMFLGRTMWMNSDNPDFCGWMDEVRIYSRALNEDEIDELYMTTCPEPMATVSITHELEDGTVIGEETYATVAEGSSYTYNAPATIEHEGMTYSLSYTLSTLSIKSVDSYNNKITAVYVVKEVTGQKDVSAEAYINTVPKLPETVTLTYNTGETASAAAEWTDVPPSGWSKAGEYTVSGVADGYDVKATVTVYEITGTNVPEITYTDLGSQPELPASAIAYTSNGRTITSDIVWDKLPEDKILEGENFEISGYLADFPDVAVITMVEFIIRAVTRLTPVADTYVSGDNGNWNHGGEDEITISSRSGSSGASYTRHGFLRFANPGANQAIGAKLKLFMRGINNGGYTTYTLYAFDNSDWDEYELTMNNWEIYAADAEEIAYAYYQPTSYEETVNDWLEFDIGDYVLNNLDKAYFNFYITASTCASYFSSREGSNPPVLEIEGEGKELTVKYQADGDVIRIEKIAVPASGPYIYVPRAAIVKDNRLYVSEGDVEIYDTAYFDEIEVKMIEADYEIETPEVITYYDEKPKMPSSVKVIWDGGEMELPVAFEDTDIDDIGTYTVYGDADGLEVRAKVKAYGRYYNNNGTLLGYAGRVNVEYQTTDGKTAADTVERLVRVGTGFDAQPMVDYYPQLVSGSITQDVDVVTEPEHTVIIQGTLLDGVSGFASAALSGDDPADYTVNVSVVAANTAQQAGKAMIIIAKYDEEGKMVEFKTDTADLGAEMTGRNTDLELTFDYDRESGEDIRIYLWDLGQVRPIYEVIRVSELPDPEKYSEELLALIPEYDEVKENVLRANDYRQSTWGPGKEVNGIDLAFWDTAAYHTGNMEVYKTFGGDEYLEYSLKWADINEWKGNDYGGDPSRWTWGYNQSQGSDAVLFGDWQICFQTYLDLYMIDPDRANIDRVFEVIDYQMSIDPAEENRSGGAGYWWWADALYMVPPVYTKLYTITGDEEYLDKLYEYYRYAAELMYDGELGIPTSEDGYTTAAGRSKRSGSYFSDPDNYAHLFFRDAGYVYPLNPNAGHANEKNFWARGNGWVFAGLAKILSDMPLNYENRDFFVTIYNQMAQAIIDCQMQDDEGRGFWTQSMLQNYPVGNNGNNWGYETSGTAFLTYGLFWGLNNAVLDEETYLEPALRGWKYLSEIALQDNGKVGYCQPIGSNATQATPQSTDQPFGYGAFLLAGCEASRWVDGFEQ